MRTGVITAIINVIRRMQMKKVVARIERNKKAANKSEQDLESPALTLSVLKTRSLITPGRNKPIPTVSVTELREVRCVICGMHSHNNSPSRVLNPEPKNERPGR